MLQLSNSQLGSRPGGKGASLSDKNLSVASSMAHFGGDSVKVVAESNGISNLADDAARLLADDITMRLKCLVQDAAKFASHSRRSQLTFADIEHALKNKNISPMFGFNDPDILPFRYASGGGRELFFQEEKEVELSDVINMSSMARLPQDVALKNHWLSIDGIQPAIPDNPPPLNKDRQRIESIDPLLVLKLQSTPNTALSNPSQNKFISQKKKKQVEVIKVKQYATHELSVEQQLYYKEITEACVGSDENRRSEALQSLMYDSGLHQMLPRLCTFISEGVKVNVVQYNLALLIYLMRMVKALLDNHNLYLEKYLHELIPTVITCIVSKQLCLRPEQDNHWALRDFGSRLLTQICRNFNTNTNNIQVRVTQLLSQSLDKERIVLPSLYGAISCLCEMGTEVQRTFLVKRLKPIGERLRINIETNVPSVVDKTAAEHIKQLILRVLPATIKSVRSAPDILEEYKNEYGYLGPLLHAAVEKMRGPSQNQPKLNITSGQPGQIQGANFGQLRRVSNQSSGQAPQVQPHQRYTILNPSSAQPSQGQPASVFRGAVSLISGAPNRFNAIPGTGQGGTLSNSPSTSSFASNLDHQN